MQSVEELVLSSFTKDAIEKFKAKEKAKCSNNEKSEKKVASTFLMKPIL